MAANRGFLRTVLETILQSFFFGGLDSSLSSESFREDARVEYDTLRVPSPQSRVQAFRSFELLDLGVLFAVRHTFPKQGATLGHFTCLFFQKQL